MSRPRIVLAEWPRALAHGINDTEPIRPAGADLRGDLSYEVAFWDGNLVARVELSRPVQFTS